jgi:hypothetical protein
MEKYEPARTFAVTVRESVSLVNVRRRSLLRSRRERTVVADFRRGGSGRNDIVTYPGHDLSVMGYVEGLS